MDKYPSSEAVFAEKGQAMSTDQSQPANMDEAFIERARGHWPDWANTQYFTVAITDKMKELAISYAAAFASSIQAEACQDTANDAEIIKHHGALIGKIQAVVDESFPGERWADYDVLNQGVHRILERAEAAEQRLAQAYKDRDTFTEQLRDALGAPSDRTWFNTGLLEVARTKVQQLAESRSDLHAVNSKLE